MTVEALRLAAADNLWGAIMPELMLGCVALLLLALEVVLPRRLHGVIPDVASAGLLGTLLGLGFNWNSVSIGRETFNGLLFHGTGGQLMRAFFQIGRAHV